MTLHIAPKDFIIDILWSGKMLTATLFCFGTVANLGSLKNNFLQGF